MQSREKKTSTLSIRLNATELKVQPLQKHWILVSSRFIDIYFISSVAVFILLPFHNHYGSSYL